MLAKDILYDAVKNALTSDGRTVKAELYGRADLRLTKLDWSTGLILAAKVVTD